MSTSREQRRRRIKRERRQQRNDSLKPIVRGIIICAAGLILVTGGVLFFSGVFHPESLRPAQVEGVSAKACYHDITLRWDPAKKAKGYVIYEADPSAGSGEPQFERIGEISGGENCSFEMDEYIHDEEYLFRVAAYGENWLTKEQIEGEPSGTVSAIYDSQKYAQKIPVLTYHDLVPGSEPIKNGLWVQEDMFRQQMQYLKDNDYRTLSPDEFYQWYQGKLELPKKSCMVTFDDGAYEIYYLAYPILKANGQKATEFCIGHHLDENPVTAPFTPEDGIPRRFGPDVVKELRTDYPDFACESHTYNMHKRIDGYKPVNVLTYEQMMEDFQKNEKYDFHYMAYPWGVTNKKLKKAAKDSGIKLAFGYGPFRYARRSDDQYRINRIKVSAYYSMDTFMRIVDGTWEEEAEE